MMLCKNTIAIVCTSDGGTNFFNIVLQSDVKLATVVEGDQKAPFPIATKPRCWGGRYSLLHFTLDTYLILLSYARRYQIPFLKSLV